MIENGSRYLLLAASLAALAACGSKDSKATGTAAPSAPAAAPKSIYEKFADSVCACTDERCAGNAVADFEAASSRQKNAKMSPADESAVERAEKCIDKLMPEK